MIKKKHIYFVLTHLMLLLLLSVPHAVSAKTLAEEVLENIQRNYYLSVNLGDFRGKTVEEMVESLPDDYSTYISPTALKRLMDNVGGRAAGIGLEAADIDGYATVIDVLEKSPAYEAGIRSGDRIVSVNGQTVVGSNLDVMTTLLSKIEETDEVKLVLRRGYDFFTVSLTGFFYERASVTSFLLDNNILIIKISSFNNNSYYELKNILANPRYRNVTGYILDLRSNTGGTFQAAIQIANEIVGEGPLVQTVSSSRQKRVSFGSGAGLDKPLIVLVNNYTASAAEILASAIQDNNKGIILGERTYGKGLVQSVYRLSNGGALRLTTAEYLSPGGRKIDARGITPDYVVGVSDQSTRAVSLVQNYYLYPDIWGFSDQAYFYIDKSLVEVDGEKFLANPTKINNSRSFIPLRLLANLVNAQIIWHQKEKTAELVFEGGTKTLEIQSNNQRVVYDDKVYHIDTPGFIENNFFYVPVRSLVEMLGKSADWTEEEKKVTIF